MYQSSFNQNQKLKVAVLKDALPFSDCTEGGKPKGITVKIWEKVADKYNIDYEYLCVDRKYDDTLIDLSKGKYDVALAEFSVIDRRYELALYSRPFFVSKMKIYRKKNDSSLKNFLQNRIIKLLILSAFLILLIYTLIRKNALRIPILDALYDTYTIFFTNVKDFIPLNKRLNPTKIKIINGVWVFIRYVFFTIVVAQAINIIVKTTNHISDEEYDSIKSINVLKGTSYVDYVKNIGKQPSLNNTNQEIVDKLIKSNYNEYWLDDYNVIVNALDKSPNNLELDSTLTSVVNDEFAIAINRNHPDILEKINKMIVESQDNGDMLKLCKGYMKVDFENCSM